MNKSFGGKHRLHLQGEQISTLKMEALLPRNLGLYTEYTAPILQKVANFIIIAVRTSDPKYGRLLGYETSHYRRILC
jgi:hypothetical protein